LSANTAASFTDAQIENLKQKVFSIHTIMDERSYALRASAQSRLDKIKDQIFAEECKNAQAAYDETLADAKKYISKLDYIRASEKLHLAIRGAQDIPECGIDASQSKKLLEKYASATKYQETNNTIQELLGKQAYEKSLELYIQNQGLYNTANLKSQGIKHKILAEYILGHANHGFIAFCAVHYSNDEESLDFVNQLITVLFNKNLSYKFYYDFGKQLGRKNKPEFLGYKYKNVITRYSTPDNKNFKKFKKGYKKGFK